MKNREPYTSAAEIMADSAYNPFMQDDEEEIEDSIVAAAENPAVPIPTISPSPEAESPVKDEPSYDAIAAKLLKDHLALSALELHVELVESGRELPRLRDYFSNPGNFERQLDKESQLLPLHRTSSETTFDSLDLARYSDDGANQADDRYAVLEFELRKARETIKSLRANLTEAAESDVPSPEHMKRDAEGLSKEEGLKPLEARALNYLINEYMLNNNYKLTSITFSDENEDQDFDDWDDVGLNIARPPDLLHLYRDYSRHVIPIIITETADVACGNDSVNGDQPEEAEADLGMALDEERQNRESKMKDIDDQIVRLTEENETLKNQIKDMEREMETLQAPKESTPSISPICTPRKDNYRPGERRQPIGADAETLSNHAEAQTNQGTAIIANGETDGDDSVLAEELDCDLPEGHTVSIKVNGPEEDSGAEHREEITIHRHMAEPFQKALIGTVLQSSESTDLRLREEVSKIPNSTDGVIEMLARCLPHIVPNVLLAKREELVPLILCSVTLHSDPKERDKLLNLLFNLIKKPDEEQRQVILSGCVAFAKHVGPTRAEAELLPQCWEQITHKYPERRLLVAESCGVLSPYLPNEIRSSLVLSMLQQMLDDKVEVVREAAIKSLGLVFSLIKDTDKYNQGLELILSALNDSAECVVLAVQQVFLPAFAHWAHELDRLETNLVASVLKRMELAAMDLQRASPDSSATEHKLQLYCSTLQCLIPALYVSIIMAAPLTTETQETIESDIASLEVTRFPKPLCMLHDIAVIVGSKGVLATRVHNFESHIGDTSREPWANYSWVTNEFIPRLLEVLGRLDASLVGCIKQLSKLFLNICRTFGRVFTDAKIKPKFQAVLNVPEDQREILVQSGQTAVTKATLPVYAVGVLGSHNREEDRKQLEQFLQESVIMLALCNAPIDSLKVTYLELHTHPTYHELLLASLWGCVVHASAAVRVFCAQLFEVLVKGMNEGLVSSRVTPALITLSGDLDLSVKLATIPAFGTIMENTSQKETLDRVYIQFQSFLDDPAYRDEHSLLVELIHTFGKVGPNAEPKFRDEFVLPRLAAIAHANNNTSNESRKSDVAVALFGAYSALSCCFVSDDLIREAMLPGLRCLRQDLENTMPEHDAVVSSMIKEMEGKLFGKERSPSVSSANTNTGFANLSEDARRTLFNKIGAQRTKMATVFHAKKK